MHGDSNMETYITICEIDSQRESAVCLRKLKQGLCINLEGWDGEGDEREVQKGRDICIPMADFMHWRRKWQPTPSILAWRIPGTGEPGELPSMASHRVGHD